MPLGKSSLDIYSSQAFAKINVSKEKNFVQRYQNFDPSDLGRRMKTNKASEAAPPVAGCNIKALVCYSEQSKLYL